jgi:hypothetical protein
LSTRNGGALHTQLLGLRPDLALEALLDFGEFLDAFVQLSETALDLLA